MIDFLNLLAIVFVFFGWLFFISRIEFEDDNPYEKSETRRWGWKSFVMITICSLFIIWRVWS